MITTRTSRLYRDNRGSIPLEVTIEELQIEKAPPCDNHLRGVFIISVKWFQSIVLGTLITYGQNLDWKQIDSGFQKLTLTMTLIKRFGQDLKEVAYGCIRGELAG